MTPTPEGMQSLSPAFQSNPARIERLCFEIPLPKTLDRRARLWPHPWSVSHEADDNPDHKSNQAESEPKALNGPFQRASGRLGEWAHPRQRAALGRQERSRCSRRPQARLKSAVRATPARDAQYMTKPGSQGQALLFLISRVSDKTTGEVCGEWATLSLHRCPVAA